MVDAQELSKSCGMSVILPQRVLEPASFAKYDLRPLGVPFAAEDPPTTVLRFYDEDTKSRYNDMIDLCGTVGGRDNYVVNGRVNLFVQRSPYSGRRCMFANPAADDRAKAHYCQNEASYAPVWWLWRVPISS